MESNRLGGVGENRAGVGMRALTHLPTFVKCNKPEAQALSMNAPAFPPRATPTLPRNPQPPAPLTRMTLGAVATVALVSLATQAQAQPPAASPWYVEGSLGAVFEQGHTISTRFSYAGRPYTSPGTNTMGFSPGPAVEAGIGYRLPHGFRVQADIGWRFFTQSTAEPNDPSGAFPTFNGQQFTGHPGARQQQGALTLSVLYDLPTPWAWCPYVGLGAAYVHTRNGGGDFQADTGARLRENATDSDGFGLTGEAGIAIPLTASLDLVPSYRYQHVFGANRASADDHMLRIGLRYDF